MFRFDYIIAAKIIKCLCVFCLLWLTAHDIQGRNIKKMYTKLLRVGNYEGLQQKLGDFNIKYIEQTTLRRYIPWITVRRFLGILIMIFVSCLFLIYMKSSSIWLGFALASVITFCPLILLDTLRQYNYQKTRGELIHFLSLLSQWYMVTEDIIKCFDKISQQNLSEPMSTYIDDFVIQVHSGLEVSDALEILGWKIESDFFDTIVVNIDQAIQNRGDVGVMLDNLQEECYRLQEEFNRRKISTIHDKIIIYCTMILVLIIGYHFLVLNSVTETFYFQTLLGQALVLAFSVIYVIGFFITLGLSRLEY